jgi:toxin-antitoxin system PIN domain toxin
VILCDVNVLLYAFRADSERHDAYRRWLIARLTGPENVGVSELVLSAMIRIATHPRVFVRPSTPQEAFAFAEAVRSRPNAVPVAPGPRHWAIFENLCERVQARGNLIPDAYFAAMAIESSCEWITTDRDYARFPGLTWAHPLEGGASAAR